MVELTFDRLWKLLHRAAILLLAGLVIFLVLRLATLPENLQVYITPLLWLLAMAVAALVGTLALLARPPSAPHRTWTPRSTRAFDAAFVVLLAGIVWAGWSSDYYPDLTYYFIAAGAAAILGTKILAAGKNPSHIGWTLLEVLALGLVVRASRNIMNPYPVGNDSFIHLNLIYQILKDGHMDATAGPYQFYPLYHVYLAFCSLVFGDVSAGVQVPPNLVQVMGIPALFLLGRRLANARVGLLAGFIFAVSSLALGIAIGLQPMAQGVTYFLLALVGFLGYRTARDAILFWLPALALFFVHPFPAFVLVLVLGASRIVKHARRVVPLRGYRPLYFVSFSYGLGFIAYLVLVNSLIFINVIYWAFVPDFRTPVFGASLHPHRVTGAIVGQALFQYLGTAAILGLATHGMFQWFRERDFRRTLLVAVVLLLVSVPLTNVLSGEYWAGGMIVGRAPPFVWALLGLPAGATLATVSPRGLSRRGVPVALALLFTFAFVSTSSYQSAAYGLPTESQIPLGPNFVTESGAMGHQFLDNLPEGARIYADDGTSYFLLSPRGLGGVGAVKVLPLDRANGSGYLVLNWPYLRLDPAGLDGSQGWPQARATIATGANDQLYDNGGLQIYHLVPVPPTGSAHVLSLT